jgi:hypothetical protein
MIDISCENLITLSEATRLIPSRLPGKKVDVSTLNRWSTHGCKGEVLETVQVGARRGTSVEAVSRFLAALSTPARLDAVRNSILARRGRRQRRSTYAIR